MNSVLAVSTVILLTSLCLLLIGGLILLVDLFGKFNKVLKDSYALQRMITTHGNAQLAADGRLSKIDEQLSKLLQRELQMRSLTNSIRSVEGANALLDNTGETNTDRLVRQSGLTEREANLMIQLRSAYSTDNSSPPDLVK